MASNNHPLQSTKISTKPLKQQIDVVAEFHAHRIHPERIAYRTGIDIELITALINGDSHQQLFKFLLARHRKIRREQRLKNSRRIKGIGQAVLQEQIEKDYQAPL